MAASKIRLSPAARIALGLASLTVMIVLMVFYVLGIMPDRIESAKRLQVMQSRMIAQETTSLLQAGNLSRLNARLQQTLDENNELRSIGIRQFDKSLIAEAGPHQLIWPTADQHFSGLDAITIPIDADKTHWGDIELTFHSASPGTLLEWLKLAPLAAALLVSSLSFIAFYLFLRRVLEYLDPMAVIPERVRTAYDTFKEAVLVLDPSGKIVLANEAFRKLHPDAAKNINGKAASSLGWLTAGLPLSESRLPWMAAMQDKAPFTAESVEIAQTDGAEALQINLNCSPISDTRGTTRGCLMVLADVTALHQANRQLRQTLDELAESQKEIEAKNLELQQMATRDPLTGCLNRRALFAAIEPLFARIREEKTSLCCVMGDIDHFKAFNDRYGHSIGDLVIKAVSRTMGQGLRECDILCRYGGEEFCIFLPGATTEQAMAITERLRVQIDTLAGQSIREQAGLHITSSFGLTSIENGAANPEEMIDQADQALYHSKKTGRNRVSVWSAGMESIA